MTGGTAHLPVASAAGCRRGIWRVLAGDRLTTAVVVVLNAAAAVAGLAGPWLLGGIIDTVESGGPVSRIDGLAVAFVGCTVVGMLLTRFARYAAHRLAERALARLREDFVTSTLSLPQSVVERAGTGDLMTRSSDDVAAVGRTLRDAAPEVLASAVNIVFVLVAIVLLDPLLGLCTLAGTPLLAVGLRWYLRRARTAYLVEGEAKSDLSESLTATVDGARTVEAYGLQRHRLGVVDDRVARASASRMRPLFLRNVLFPVVDFSHTLPLVLVLVAGGLMYTQGDVRLGAVVAASLYAWRLVDPIDRILMWVEQLQSSGASLARVLGVREAAPAATTSTAEPAGDQVAVTGVRYAYDGGPDVLRGVDLTVRPGERLAVVGPSGAGKSTLGRLLAGVEGPRTGSVTVGGVAVVDLPPELLRRTVVLVTQEHHVFVGTVRENLVIAAPAADDADLHAALDAVEAGWVTALPRGLDTEVGAGGHPLDARQAQQLALARVLLADPHTVVLDEATALLDPTSARHVERAIAALLHERTVVAIAHRLHTAHDADRIAVLEDGVVTELGSHAELVAAGGPYASLWRSWHGDH